MFNEIKKAIALRPKIAIAFCSTPLMRSLMMIVQDDFSNSALAESEFEEYIDQFADPVAPEIEIDSVADDLGELYRVWNGSQLLGTFYQNLEGKWVAQPCNRDDRPCCDTPLAAQIIIIAVNGLLVADAA